MTAVVLETCSEGERLNLEHKLPRRIEKPWGFELLFAHTSKYAGKIIFVRKGHRLSLQYHERKDESMYIHVGTIQMEISIGNGHVQSSILRQGDSIRILPLTRHRVTAIDDTTIFEVSTAELDDVKRIEDDYGRTIP